MKNLILSLMIFGFLIIHYYDVEGMPGLKKPVIEKILIDEDNVRFRTGGIFIHRTGEEYWWYKFIPYSQILTVERKQYRKE